MSYAEKRTERELNGGRDSACSELEELERKGRSDLLYAKVKSPVKGIEEAKNKKACQVRMEIC